MADSGLHSPADFAISAGIRSVRAQRRTLPVAALAQVVEHIIRNDGVAGSSPASGTINFLSNIDSL
jgi:hypothetical protein